MPKSVVGRSNGTPKLSAGRERITVDLRGLEAPLRSRCERLKQSRSEFITRAIAGALEVDPPRLRREASPLDESGRGRLRLTLSKAERQSVFDRAQRAGTTDAAYAARVLALADEGIHETVRLTPGALDALVRSNYELRAIGRNLNQIAHAANAARGALSVAEVSALEALVQEIKTHLGKSAGALQAMAMPKRRKRGART